VLRVLKRARCSRCRSGLVSHKIISIDRPDWTDFVFLLHIPLFKTLSNSSSSNNAEITMHCSMYTLTFEHWGEGERVREWIYSRRNSWSARTDVIKIVFSPQMSSYFVGLMSPHPVRCTGEKDPVRERVNSHWEQPSCSKIILIPLWWEFLLAKKKFTLRWFFFSFSRVQNPNQRSLLSLFKNPVFALIKCRH